MQYKETLKSIGYRFFGTWDRGLSSISFLVTAIGTGVTLFLIEYPKEIPQYIAWRDLLFWIALITLSMSLLAKYLVREQIIRKQMSLLSNQLKYPHYIVHNYRDELFRHYYQHIKRKHRLTTEDLDVFRKVCSHITDGVRTSLLEYFYARNIADIGDDVSVSVKLIVPADQVVDWFSLSQEEAEKIKTKEDWIITASRDSYTLNQHPDRELGLSIYDIWENTAFRRVVKDGERCFFHNELKSLGTAYENQNRDWGKYYNAAIVVPIRYQRVDRKRYKCYGLLCADSVNDAKRNLYNDKECRHILSHAANLLATFFLNLELIENNHSPSGNAGITNTGSS